MSRSLRLFTVGLAAVAMVATAAVAFAGPGCNSKASTQQASACGSKAKVELTSAEGGYCSASALAACASKANMSKAECQAMCEKTTAALSNYSPFSFVKAAKEHNVTLGIQPTETGFAIVFAGGTDASIASAKTLASQSVEMIGKPAACSTTRDAMAKKAGGCESTSACLSALADANVTMVETENGAVTSITSKDAKKVEQLHTFLTSLNPVEVKSDSE